MNDPKDRVSINKNGSIHVSGEMTKHRLGQLTGHSNRHPIISEKLAARGTWTDLCKKSIFLSS